MVLSCKCFAGEGLCGGAARWFIVREQDEGEGEGTGGVGGV